jgi:hypothetical protein
VLEVVSGNALMGVLATMSSMKEWSRSGGALLGHPLDPMVMHVSVHQAGVVVRSCVGVKANWWLGRNVVKSQRELEARGGRLKSPSITLPLCIGVVCSPSVMKMGMVTWRLEAQGMVSPLLMGVWPKMVWPSLAILPLV